ncbi:MAG: hypothetical protein A3F54_04445 [Candidatus Kerfeldbacteria bacterium RIFCSPHIGHO2_12_FULL_48_17]|uniref:DUF218 domain-containing protein n=1 Tax=Candidatus Kerfeldbacteria bacterium RIFCSPHIGHO2_12_FULL_48_17 TaxID=1798542 RepID=A0A1G2B1I5_9BACT|nr:MAG: hypothetical protein A3F54_04445 [Candidatus Kerfeldbacteria bacterium RIFCSPHIGHO2_12_FULL_48_17]
MMAGSFLLTKIAVLAISWTIWHWAQIDNNNRHAKYCGEKIGGNLMDFLVSPGNDKRHQAMIEGKVWNLYVNGYGSPPDPKTDGNLRHYMGAVKEFIAGRPDPRFRVFLVGPPTTRNDITEAQALKIVFEAVGVPDNVIEIIIIDDAIGPDGDTGARLNLERASQIMPQDLPAVFAFEHSRRFYMKWLARRYFKNIQAFLPVKFDAGSLRFQNQIKMATIKFALEVAAYYSPFIARFARAPLRKKHVEKCKAEVQEKIEKDLGRRK